MEMTKEQLVAFLHKNAKVAIKVLDDKTIIEEANKRKQRLKETVGKYATSKKITPCPWCGEAFSARGHRVHRTTCSKRVRGKQTAA